MDYDPTSKEECKALCEELGIDPERFWGVVNNFACDCFHSGQQDVMRNGPANLATGHRMTKEEALAWIEKVYG